MGLLNQFGDSSATINAAIASAFNERTGWADYIDTAYTSGSPLSLVADTDTILKNNAGTIREQEKPTTVNTFYSPATLLIDGITEGFTVGDTLTGGSSGATATPIKLYQRISTFPKGNGVERPLNFTTGVYKLDTWEKNGGRVFIRANGGTADVYDIRFIVHKTHRGRGIYPPA